MKVFWPTRFKEEAKRRRRCAVFLDRSDKQAHLVHCPIELDREREG